MAAVDLRGLHPRFSATVMLHAARKGHPVAGVTEAARQLARARDPLGLSSLIEEEEATARLSGPGDGSRFEVERDGRVLQVRPIDVIPTLTAGLWPDLLLDADARAGWWVAEHDLVEALLSLAAHPVPEGSLVLSGRRRWQASELMHEAALLHRRWEQGQVGAFSVEVLAEPQRPPVRVESVGLDDQEPDLGPLHRLLSEHRSEGWRPQMTVREALMHHLALVEGALNRG